MTRRCGSASSSPLSGARTPTAGSSTAWAAASRRSPRSASWGRRRAPTRTWTTRSARSPWTVPTWTGAATAETCRRPSDRSRWTRGMADAPGPEGVVVIHNTNTGKLIRSRFPVEDGRAAVEGETAIPGVPGTGAPGRPRVPRSGRGGHGRAPPDRQRPRRDRGRGRGQRSGLDGRRGQSVRLRRRGRNGDHGNGDAGRARRPGGGDGTAGAHPRRGRGRDGNREEPRRGVVPVSGRAQGSASWPRPGLATTLRGESVEATEGDLTARMVSMNNVHRALPLTGCSASRSRPRSRARWSPGRPGRAARETAAASGSSVPPG